MKKKNYLITAFLLLTISFSGCGLFSDDEPEEKKSTTCQVVEDETFDATNFINKCIEESNILLKEADEAIDSYKSTSNQESFNNLYQTLRKLSFTIDFPEDVELSKDQEKKIKDQKELVKNTRNTIIKLLSPNALNYLATVIDNEDYLLKETTTIPFYACKNSTLYISMSLKNTTCKIYNRDSHDLLKQYTNKQNITDSIVIPNSAIYIVEYTPKGHQYVDAKITNRMASSKDLENVYPIITKRVEANSKAFKVEKCPGIKIEPIFYEPRKVTLARSGQGEQRSVVAMQIPNNCDNILYSLRISTNEADVVKAGAFAEKMDKEYQKIRFLGIPLVEVEHSSTNLFRELLNKTHPVREEDAYCNLYVFTDANQAKRFQEGAEVSSLKYNMDLTKQGTQSCNDRIKTKGVKTLYFGFDNPRLKYNIYLWLESVGTLSTTEYFKTTYELEK